MSKITVKSLIKKSDLDKVGMRISKNFAVMLKREIADIIVEKILSGNSPVAGYGRFKKYSKKYGERVKGRREPVDMVLTGEMLESLTVAQSRGSGDIRIFFKDEKAEWHDLGEGNLPIRRLLPSGNREQFKRDISNKIIKILERAVKKSTK